MANRLRCTNCHRWLPHEIVDVYSGARFCSYECYEQDNELRELWGDPPRHGRVSEPRGWRLGGGWWGRDLLGRKRRDLRP